ncbi:unnamed protein product [Trifolium pratense]|uniref:Uncharacterized protein n=1 Tax=Trifolium pratense TaxID=57577 RepID=A0ACB0LDT1_TRIPR|nr:unnamed protein product [Trifolium pratense]
MFSKLSLLIRGLLVMVVLISSMGEARKLVEVATKQNNGDGVRTDCFIPGLPCPFPNIPGIPMIPGVPIIPGWPWTPGTPGWPWTPGTPLTPNPPSSPGWPLIPSPPLIPPLSPPLTPPLSPPFVSPISPPSPPKSSSSPLE